VVATGGLFAVSALFASSSLTRGTLLTMLPFAAALAIASLGQTLVVMQGGIDLSVAGGLSLYVVIVTKYPAGDNARLLPAIAIAFAAAVVVVGIPAEYQSTAPKSRAFVPSVATMGFSLIRPIRNPFTRPAQIAARKAMPIAGHSRALSPAGYLVTMTTYSESPPATDRSMPPCMTTRV